MCLGVPGRVVVLREEMGTPMATVDFGGVTKDVCLAFTPDAVAGDYVVVHAGFAITTVDEDAAQESLRLFAAMRGANDAGAPYPDEERAP